MDEEVFDLYALRKDDNPAKTVVGIIKSLGYKNVAIGDETVAIEGKAFYFTIGKNYLLFTNGTHKIQPVWDSKSNTESSIKKSFNSVIQPVMSGLVLDYLDFVEQKNGLAGELSSKTGLDIIKTSSKGTEFYKAKAPKGFKTLSISADGSKIHKCTFEANTSRYEDVDMMDIERLREEATLELDKRFDNMAILLASLGAS